MHSDPIITVENLGKRYQLGAARQSRGYVSLRDVAASSARNLLRRGVASSPRETGAAAEKFWALKDVSFQIGRGEVVGIVGRNGAGKSTLLKILSRITDPTEGRITLRGRVASLLEVGTGFHPELTGRENIFLNGAILGMHRTEIKAKFDEIVAFAEVEKFLDTPVKRYSSGMYVRLAFAVAAHLEPEILIVDEVLAVGDAEFQKKCLGKMKDVSRGEGRTVLFVSHNIAAVQGLCNRGIHLRSGRVMGVGNISDVISGYLQESSQAGVGRDGQSRLLGGALELQAFEFSPYPAESGRALDFRLTFTAKQPTRILDLAILLYSGLGTRVAILDLRAQGIKDLRVTAEPCTLRGTIRDLPLVEGDYQAGLYVNADAFMGNFLELVPLEIAASTRPRAGYVPHAPEHRGYVELDFALHP